MINIQIDEDKMKAMLFDNFKEHIKNILADSELEYWVRNEVHKLLSQELIENAIKPMLTKDKINQLLIDSCDRYIHERFNAD